MAITSSIHKNLLQGSDRLIIEHHVDANGFIYVWTYTTDSNTNVTDMLALHNQQLIEQLQAQEFTEIING